MKNLKKLSRNELKNVFGGQSCTHTIQGSDGKWVTRTGECKTVKKMEMMDFGIVQIPTFTTESYCDTGLGNIPVTSKNGNSRC